MACLPTKTAFVSIVTVCLGLGVMSENRIFAQEQSTAKAKPSEEKKRAKRTLPTKIYACCDDMAAIYVNGELILDKIDLYQTWSCDCALAKGDVITVKAENKKGPSGFACVFVVKGGGIIATGPAWVTYKPRDAQKWFDPEGMTGIQKAVVGYPRPANQIKKTEGMSCYSIWGYDNPCYFTFTVR